MLKLTITCVLILGFTMAMAGNNFLVMIRETVTRY